jgi:tRNA(adenine34) deaminase
MERYVPIREKKWSGDVDTKWEPKEDIFTKSADEIAKYLKSNSKDLKQAFSRLSFYINRAGKNLSASDKSRLENAKEKLRALYK